MFKLSTKSELALNKLIKWIGEAPSAEDQLARVQYANALITGSAYDERWDVAVGRFDDTNHPPEDLVGHICPNWTRPVSMGDGWANTLH